jgi:thioredoxin-like negative regulator of GroEL
VTSSPRDQTPGPEAKPRAKPAPEKPPEPKNDPEPKEDTQASKEAVVKVKRLLRRWVSEVDEERQEAWQGLKDMGDLATPALIEVVKGGKAQERRLAITAIGLFKDKLGAEVIRKALSDEDSSVRYCAARALGEIGDTGAKDLLAKAIKEDKNAEVRYHAAYALASLGGEEAFEFFKKQLDSEKSDDRSRAVRALGSFGKGKYVAELSSALKDKDRRVRYAAIVQLDRARKKEGIPGMILALEDEDRFVRKRARSALERLTGKDFGRDKPKWEKWWKENGDKFKPKPRSTGPAAAEPIKFDNAGSIAGEADFKKLVTGAKGLVFVDFYHPRGRDCRRYAPVFDGLAKEYKGKVAMYSCAAGRATLPIIRKLGVRVPPTTVVFRDGKVVEILPGAKSAEDLKKIIDGHLDGTREVKKPPAAPPAAVKRGGDKGGEQ